MTHTYHTNAGAKYKLTAHLVWCPKYRRPVLTGEINTRLKTLIQEIAQEKEWEILSLEVVNPAYTSQYCRECGHTSPDNRKGVRFECVGCGFEGHADVLAALNIRDRGQGLTSLDKVSC